jgi:phytoene synthase
MPPLWAEREAADLAACRLLLRGGSRSFNAAARLLPRTVRDPAVALYAFCRVADDVIDADGASGADGLAGLRERLALVYASRPMPLPVDRAFARLVQQFALPRALPEALLEGFAWDAEGRRYRDLPDLRAYAVRVAGTVGAMMAILMGVRDAERLAAAIDLGVAMQLSNIARDVGEDARHGRLYLPLDWLAEAGVDADQFLDMPEHSPALGAVVRRVLDAAEMHYRRAWFGIARLPLTYRFGIGAAGLLYAEIGREVSRRGLDAVSARAIVSGRRKACVLATGLARVALPTAPPDGVPMQEAAFLLSAVMEDARAAATRHASLPWWRPHDQMRWLIELLERLEQRQRVRT